MSRVEEDEFVFHSDDALGESRININSCYQFVSAGDEVPIDDYPRRKTRPDRNRRLDIERSAHDLLADLVDALRRPLLDRLNERVPIVAHADLGADAEHSRKDGRLGQQGPNGSRLGLRGRHSLLYWRRADVRGQSSGRWA
jgi:hypothetical protein